MPKVLEDLPDLGGHKTPHGKVRQVIPADAVVAATKVLYADKMSNHSGDNAPQIIDACEAVVRKILEAAAPHIRAQALEDAANSRETERLFVFGWEARERLRTRAAAERGGE